nr:MAG TPA: hypothetical protein [Caudoviricetes sp.]
MKNAVFFLHLFSKINFFCIFPLYIVPVLCYNNNVKKGG